MILGGLNYLRSEVYLFLWRRLYHKASQRPLRVKGGGGVKRIGNTRTGIDKVKSGYC